MTYTVTVLRAAQKALAKIPAQPRQRIAATIQALADNPRPHNSIKLTDSEFWRVRVGDYRIIYLIQDKQLIVTVTDIVNRKNAY